MANALYPNFKEHLLKGDIDLDSNTVTVALIDLADYTYSAAHDNLGDVPSGAIVATTNLSSVTTTDGVVDAADAVFTAVTGDPAEAIIVYINSGSNATSYLMAFYDTGVSGLPITPNGGNVNIAINVAGLFAL